MSSREELLGFDLDGTLIDAKRRQVDLVEHLLAARGERLSDPGGFWAQKREGASTVKALVDVGLDVGVAAEVAEVWTQQIEDRIWLRRDGWLPGARGLLVRIRALGVQVAVLTARRDPRALADQFEWLGLTDLADVVHVVSPWHAVEQKAVQLARMGAIGFIGDSESDYQAAVLSGVPFVAVSTGQRSAGYLTRAGVPLIADSLEEAANRLGIG